MCTMTKSETRRAVRKKLARMTDFDRILKSELIVDDVIASGLVRDYASVLLYKSMPTEVNVDRLIDWAVAHGKKVYLPRVEGDKIAVVQYPCELKVGAYGILEPVGEPSHIYPRLVITPLLATDSEGNRLGKGKGYYDRYFASCGDCYKVGVAFREQLVEDLPTEEQDIRLDRVFVR